MVGRLRVNIFLLMVASGLILATFADFRGSSWLSSQNADLLRGKSAGELVMDTSIAKVASLGYGGFFASVSWVQVIFDQVESELDGIQSPWRSERLAMVVALDPEWEEPYHFAGLVLEDSGGGPSDEAIEYLRRAVSRFPDSWRLSIYLAMSLQAKGDSVAAAEALERFRGSSDTAVPDYVGELAASLASRASGIRGELRDLTVELQLSTDPLSRMGLSKKLGSLLESLGVPGAGDSARAIVIELQTDDALNTARRFRWLDSLSNVTAPESGSSRSP